MQTQKLHATEFYVASFQEKKNRYRMAAGLSGVGEERVEILYIEIKLKYLFANTHSGMLPLMFATPALPCFSLLSRSFIAIPFIANPHFKSKTEGR